MAPSLKLFFHDACFDGTGSAALFSAFYREVVAPGARIVPVGMSHRDGDPFEHERIDGDDNACVDFRFCADPAMRWWFDHHPTAFQPPSLRVVFDRQAAEATEATRFFDSTAPSCAGLIAVALEQRHGWKVPPHLADLPGWADTIDAARFPSASEAIAVDTAAQRLALWISRNRDPEAARLYIERLSHEGLAAAARAPGIADVVASIDRQRDASRALLRELGEVRGDVVVFDLLDRDADLSPGFLGYQLFPRCRYTVTVVRGERTIKISVGSNPWAPVPRTHDIGALCEAHGGGGHAVVGGVTLERGELERARLAMNAIVAELNR